MLTKFVVATGVSAFVTAGGSSPAVRTRYGVVLGLIVALGVPLRGTTWAQPVGAEFQVNTYTTLFQYAPAVAADADGDFVVVWASRNQDGSGYGVFGRRYTSAGAAVGAEFQVNTYTTNSQLHPAVAADGDGEFVVVWTSYIQQVDVFGQRFSSIPCGNGSLDGGEQCDDGNTVNGDCCSLSCQYESLLSPCASDGNVCTDDYCDGSGACTHPNNAAPCIDSVFCNGADTCSAGTCSTHAGDPCPGPDGDGNCAESCNEATDTCTAPDTNGSACTDGLFCNGADTCTAGSCSTHAGDPCPGPDGDGNCAESCNEATDTCTAPDTNGSACTDGLFCNGADTCTAGSCSTHAGDPCPGTDCNTCQEATDSCFDPPGAPCTDDGEVCTDDECDGAGACEHPNNAGPCDDGDACTVPDTCSGGTCGSGPAVTACTDGDGCCPAGCTSFTDDDCPGPIPTMSRLGWLLLTGLLSLSMGWALRRRWAVG